MITAYLFVPHRDAGYNYSFVAIINKKQNKNHAKIHIYTTLNWNY